MRSITFIMPTCYVVNNLAEFYDALQKISVHSFYFHMFEARLRLGKLSNDFSLWLDESLGLKELSKKIASLDPYTYTLEGLRRRISQLVKKYLEEYTYAYT